MNSELKALVTLLFDSEALVAAIAAKSSVFSLFPMIIEILTGDVPPAISGWGDLSAELAALAGTAEEADLSAYVEAKFAGAFSSAKAQAILSAVLKLVIDASQDALALDAAMKS